MNRIPEVMRLFHNSPISDLKAVKFPSELSGIRTAHIEDSLVLCDFLAWLEQVAEANRSVKPESGDNEIPLNGRLCDPAGNPPLEPPEILTESSAAEYLDQLRSQAPGFVSLSFKTIFGAGTFLTVTTLPLKYVCMNSGLRNTKTINACLKSVNFSHLQAFPNQN